MNGGIDLTQLGVSGVIVALLIVAVIALWSKYQDALERNHADQAQTLPALLAASTAMTEVTRLANRLEERERDRDRDRTRAERERDRDRRSD